MADSVGWAGPRQPKFWGPPLIYLEAGASMLGFALLMVLILHTFSSALELSPISVIVALMIHALISVFSLARLGTYPHRHFGLANMTTASRAALTAAIGGIVLTATSSPSPEVLWAITGGTAVSLALDGVDGFLARRNGTVSRYGARFDMEVDALLILLLALAAYLSQTTGIWVLLIGLMRYAFLTAQLVSMRMRGTLPDSLRRKVVCVMQGAALCLALVPIIPAGLQSMSLVLALVSLTFSFAADILYLLRNSTPVRSVALSPPL